MLRIVGMIVVGGFVLIVSLVLFTATVGLLFGESESEPEVVSTQSPLAPGSQAQGDVLPHERESFDFSQVESSATARKQPEPHGDTTALIRCPAQVERLSAYSSRWTDGFLEPKLSRTRPTNRPNVTTYIGDKAEFQNEYGAWMPVIYECDLNTVTGEVVDVRVRPGRLP